MPLNDIETQYIPLKTNPSVIDLDLQASTSLAACPFQPVKKQHIETKLYTLHLQCIKIRQDVDYISIQSLVGGQQPVFITCPSDTLALGYVHAGWIKTKLADNNIEKLEPRQWFYFADDQFCIDRTSEEWAQMELFLCSRKLISALLKLEGACNQPLLQSFVSGQSKQVFVSGPMNPTAFELTQTLELGTRNQLRQRLQLEGSMLAWLAEILSESSQPAAPINRSINANDRDAIQRIAQQIERDPCREYALSYFCALANINENKLKSLFKQIYGKTVFTYLREVRMQLAATLLKRDRMSVIEIANEVGYSNASHFARAFKEQHKLLPKAYQCLHRTRIHASPPPARG